LTISLYTAGGMLAGAAIKKINKKIKRESNFENSIAARRIRKTVFVSYSN